MNLHGLAASTEEEQLEMRELTFQVWYPCVVMRMRYMQTDLQFEARS
jgi:hypothetical protein